MATISATDFKARCLDLMDQVGEGRIDSLEITKHGRVVAVLHAPPSREDDIRSLHGCLRGSVILPEGVDLAAPVLNEPMHADTGELHG